MNQQLENKYKELGIDKKVYEFGEKIEDSLKERFADEGHCSNAEKQSKCRVFQYIQRIWV